MDVVYSVSVIEHMPRATWEGILARCRRWLAKNGRLVLTIDLIPGTKSLWNYAEGKVVEPVDIHGNIDDFVRCLNKQGFKLEELFIQQQVPQIAHRPSLCELRRQVEPRGRKNWTFQPAKGRHLRFILDYAGKRRPGPFCLAHSAYAGWRDFPS